jgi:hypothetical protein
VTCVGCIKDRIKVECNNGIASSKCYEKKCLDRYDDDQLRLALGEVLFVRFKEVERKILIQCIKIHQGSLEQCRRCGCALLFPHSVLPVGMFDETEKNEKEDEECLLEFKNRPAFICQNPKCKAIFCRRCGKSNHLMGSCSDFLEESEDALARYIHSAMDNALIRRCPSCKRY